MDVNTILIDLSIDPIDTKDQVKINYLTSTIQNIMRDYFKEFKLITTVQMNGGICNLYLCNNCGTVDLKLYKDGLITVIIDYKGNEHDWMVSFKNLEADIRKKVENLKKCFVFCPIKRGTFIRYLLTTDERLIEYDIDALVFEEKSPYQNVQIVHSRSLGNMLILDGLQNISEADLIYTETLMARGTEDYKDKEILILGGGDGALLYELLKENPKEVIMIEIDEVVMKACSKYLGKICGDVLETKHGPNYEIMVADCLKTLNDFIAQGRKFDYIFGDLTDVPISEGPHGAMWDFINTTLVSSFKIMKPHAKFMTHLTALLMEDALKMYEEQVMTLNDNIIFTTSNAFIPSFHEHWVFGQVSLKSN